MLKKYNLLHNGELKFTGTREECYAKLLELQDDSINKATQEKGWSIEPA